MESEADFLSDSGSPIGSYLNHTPTLGIPAETVQFLLNFG